MTKMSHEVADFLGDKRGVYRPFLGRHTLVSTALRPATLGQARYHAVIHRAVVRIFACRNSSRYVVIATLSSVFVGSAMGRSVGTKQVVALQIFGWNVLLGMGGALVAG